MMQSMDNILQKLFFSIMSKDSTISCTIFVHLTMLFLQIGFHISMKMKRAAVSLVESSTEHIKRRKSFSRKHSMYVLTLFLGGIIFPYAPHSPFYRICRR